MANWLERARREIPQSAGGDTAKTDEETPSAVSAVPRPGESENSRASIGSNGSASTAYSGVSVPLGDDAARLGEADEALLRDWLASIGECDVAVIENFVKRCRVDAAARAYFRNLAVNLPQSDVLEDDRRCCEQCANLKQRVCRIAYPGGLVSANRGYQPIPDLLRRCAGFALALAGAEYPLPSNDGVYTNR